METRTSIRLATSEDDVAIGELLVQSYVATYAKKMPEVVVGEERKADLRDVRSKRESACVFVAESAGEIIGSITILPPKHPDSEAPYENSANLRYLAVTPARQKEGIADSLMQHAIMQANRWGAELICLHVRKGADGIGRFYQRHGFIRDAASDLDLLPLIFLEGYTLRISTT